MQPARPTRSHVSTINAEEVQSTTDEFFKNVYKMSKLYREDMVVLRVGAPPCLKSPCWHHLGRPGPDRPLSSDLGVLGQDHV